MNRQITYTGYDPIFQQAASQWLHNYDWRWLKAQAYQESLFDETACSRVGARGVMQFMPATWEEVTRKHGFDSTDICDPVTSIHAGAAYMSKLLGEWRRERPKMDRYCLALASYNAGLGNILKAQAVMNDSALYATIARGLQDVTGAHSEETLQYVHRIFNHYRTLVIDAS